LYNPALAKHLLKTSLMHWVDLGNFSISVSFSFSHSR